MGGFSNLRSASASSILTGAVILFDGLPGLARQPRSSAGPS